MFNHEDLRIESVYGSIGKDGTKDPLPLELSTTEMKPEKGLVPGPRYRVAAYGVVNRANSNSSSNWRGCYRQIEEIVKLWEGPVEVS